MREQEQTKIQLSVVQVVAGALASVSAAVIASMFGLKGTLLGAAVTSIVATVGGALYSHSIRRAHARIQTRFNAQTGRIERVMIAPPRVRRPIRWGRVAAAAALVFALAMGAITALEVAAREPIAALLGRATAKHGGTTMGALLQNAPGAAPIAIPALPASPTPVGTVTSTVSGTATTSPTSGGKSTGTPSGTAATVTAARTPAASPTVAAPTPTAPARIPPTVTPSGATPTVAKPPATTSSAAPPAETRPPVTTSPVPAASPPAATTAARTPPGAAQP